MLQLLQAFRFAETDAAHIERLLHWAEFPPSARLLDLGSGTGFLASQMLNLRPDLSIFLVDKNEAALARVDAGFQRHCADICAIPEPDGSFDAILCCYAIGYVDACRFFSEARRLLRRGGVLFLVDMEPRQPAREQVSLFGYTVRSRSRLEPGALASGLDLDFYLQPVDNTRWGEATIPGFSILFEDVSPAIWRFKA